MATKQSQSQSQDDEDDASTDAIELLEQDHQEVKDLFDQYDELADNEGSEADKQAIALQICTMLTVHATIEEELFYPAARDALKEDDLVDEAVVEHASAKDLIAQIEGMEPGDDLYDAKVKVLGELIDHHVEEEEGEMFPKVRNAGLDLQVLGLAMASRKDDLLAEAGENSSV
ncbi:MULTISPECIES: hemerythrin domain-containing protein [unclassified Rhizobacter]|uniref:hemerythrin domain-containing protein n=1 Tax=unclassified Rhizobacter TaxID=2640088 RepID=UPI0006FC1EC1|nr:MULTISPECIES: hemerythrin domain-containing protein [unclassified Rhizobacter]KQU71522.1 hemerythrin [Rhizobacter sp. Root29]KQW13056.1 hemerythrin [Rhizobacter sp. Root1238]KRB14363.1 hemerythrin [Rhizobacter sp. Root16D2]